VAGFFFARCPDTPDGTVTTPVTVAMIQALIPLGLKAVEDALLREVAALAAASLAEGLEETLTLHRLNVFPELGVSFKATNLIERVMARLEARTRRVTRWRTSDQKLRWCASALWAMERQFRRVKHFRHLPLLQQALQNKLSLTPSAAA